MKTYNELLLSEIHQLTSFEALMYNLVTTYMQKNQLSSKLLAEEVETNERNIKKILEGDLAHMPLLTLITIITKMDSQLTITNIHKPNQ